VAHVLTTASNEFEAEIILSRLQEAGIHAWESNDLGGRRGSAGPRGIWVEDSELEQATRVLKEAQEVDEAELDRLAEGGGAGEGG
jgi:Putative prokaryotic signal transducing protein